MNIRVNINADPMKVLEIYYSPNPEIGVKEIEQLFSCGRTTAQRLRTVAQDAMIQEGIKSFNDYKVNTEVAFRAWNIDILKVENNYRKMMKLKSLQQV